MSQDIVSVSLPWSVKGVSATARKLAKEGAAKSGMTIGQWVTQAIGEAASGVSAPKLPAQPALAQKQAATIVSQKTAPVAAAPAATASSENSGDVFRRLEQRLFDISQRLDGVEQKLNIAETPALAYAPQNVSNNFGYTNDPCSAYQRRITS